MKVFFNVLLAVFISLNCSAIFAQSGRGDSDSNGSKKANQRPAPTPEIKVSDEDLGEIDESDVIKFDTELVTIPVQVFDRKGRNIPGLTQENFQVFEDGKQQEITYFSNERKPFTVALILDMSYSGTNKVNEIQQAAISFVAQLEPNDRVMVVAFDEATQILTQPTNDRKELYRAIKTTKIGSGTSVYEAVDEVIKRFAKINGRKAIVLFSDGVDTTSRKANSRDNLQAALELDALIYPIKYDTYADVQRILNGQQTVQLPSGNPIPDRKTPNPTGLPFPLPNINIGGGGGTRGNDPNNNGTGFPGGQSQGIPNGSGTSREEYRFAGEYLEELATRTGGRLYEADSSIGNLALVFSRIAEELRQFYSLGYAPPEEGKADKFRKLKVSVNQKGMAVKARSGYVRRKK